MSYFSVISALRIGRGWLGMGRSRCRPRLAVDRGLPGLTSLLVGLAIAPATQAALCPAQLRDHLDAALGEAPLDTAYVGLVLQTQAASPQQWQTLYATNGDRLFTPASNAKLLTTAAALHRLGATYRIRTSVYASGNSGGGNSGGGNSGGGNSGGGNSGGLTTLRVLGRGDPTVTPTQITALAQQIRQAGVTQVSRLVLDDSYFPGWATHPTWEWVDAQFYFAVPVNGLILNENAVAVQVAPTQIGQPLSLTGLQSLPAGPWPVVNHSLTGAAGSASLPVSLQRHGDSATLYLSGQLAQDAEPDAYTLAVLNPAEQFAAALQTELTNQGIIVAQVEIAQTPAASLGQELAMVESPPLAELLVPANRQSDNLYAEVLLKTLGVVGTTTPPADASRAGADVVKTTLAELGVNTAPLRVADGSGLSRHNLVSPAALVETLQVMAVHPQAQVFRDSLAVAGVNGTLQNRLVNTPLAGRLQGKSGALTGNVALTGYLQPPNYDPLVFSIIINHSNQHASLLRAKIDQLLLLIAQLSKDC